VLLHVTRTHVVAGEFVDGEFFDGLGAIAGAVGAGKFYGLLLVEFIDLEIPLGAAAGDRLFDKPAASAGSVAIVCFAHRRRIWPDWPDLQALFRLALFRLALFRLARVDHPSTANDLVSIMEPSSNASTSNFRGC
jgi:hypothetical protein